MAWLETVSDALPSFALQHVLTLLITVLTLGLTWGIRPAISHFLQRLGPRWSGTGATLVQLLIVGGGMGLIVRVSGLNALLLVLAVTGAFGVGWVSGGETWLSDLAATRRIRSRRLYQVGDWVTLGDRTHGGGYHGVVAAIGRVHTKLDNSGQVTVLIRNSQVVRHPVLVHQQPEAVHGASNTAAAPSTAADAAVDQDDANTLRSEALDTVALLPGDDTLAPTDAPSSQSPMAKHPVATAIDINHLPIANPLPQSMPQNDYQRSVGSSTATEPTEAASGKNNESPAKRTSRVQTLIRSPIAPPLTKRATLGRQTIRYLYK